MSTDQFISPAPHKQYMTKIVNNTWDYMYIETMHENNNCYSSLPGTTQKLAPELSETLTQYTILVVLKLLTRTPASLPVWSNTKDNPEETGATKMKNPKTRTHTSFTLA